MSSPAPHLMQEAPKALGMWGSVEVSQLVRGREPLKPLSAFPALVPCTTMPALRVKWRVSGDRSAPPVTLGLLAGLQSQFDRVLLTPSIGRLSRK